MAHSLEVRVPLLDHRLVEWASSLPPELKLHRGAGKFVFKKMLEPDLPHDVLYRAKMGFGVPAGSMVPRPTRRPCSDRHCWTGALAESGLFEPAMLDRLVRQHAAGQRDHSATLWSLLMLDAFLRRMEQPAPAAVSAESMDAVSAAGALP